ncbi:MAG: DUF5908 family protein [Vicinamibacterales bacterium]
MPIEIRELVIRATVGEAPPEALAAEPTEAVDTAAFVEECVRLVLRILKRQRER